MTALVLFRLSIKSCVGATSDTLKYFASLCAHEGDLGAVDRLLSSKLALQPLFDKLRHRTYLHQQAEQAAKDGATFTITLSSKVTKPEPFNLTPSKPKPPPQDPEADEVEEVSARVPTARPAPPRLEGLTKEEKAIQQHKCAPTSVHSRLCKYYIC